MKTATNAVEMTGIEKTYAGRNPVDLPRPRDVDMLTDSTFNALRRDILRQIREEAGKSGAAH